MSTESAPVITEDQKALAKQTVTSIVTGKVKIADVWGTLTATPQPGKNTLSEAPPKPLPITDAQRKALRRIPEIYGAVSPEKNRMLTSEEAQRVVEERDTIDVILGLLKSRKDDSIREILANHLDHVLAAEKGDDVQGLPIDKKGHYQVKQEHSVLGSGKKIQKTVSSPSPTLSMAAVEQAHEDGLLDRKTYLAITRLPEVPRVLDEDGLTKAVKKDPSLLFTLAGLTTTASPTTTIKVVDDK